VTCNWCLRLPLEVLEWNGGIISSTPTKTTERRDRGARGGGNSSPPSPHPLIEKLLFYCFHGPGTPLFPVTPEQVYRRIYFEALDLIVSSIEERLDQPSFKAF